MPCNFHLRALAAQVKDGIREAGGTPMEFNTIAISDGITMGTAGMKTSLVSREVIADSIELVARGHYFDAVIALSGCDKTIPGTVMALARLDVPAVMLYGGSIPPGRFQGRDVTIQDVFEAIGAHAAGRDDRRGARRARVGRVSGRRRVRRAVHGQHDGDGLRDARDLADRRLADARPGARPSRQVARAAGALVDGRAAPRPAPERDDHPPRASRTRSPRSRRAAARPTACCTCSRSPARPGSSSRSTTSTRSASARRCCATSSRAGASSRWTSTRAGGVAVLAQPPRRGGPPARGRADRHRPDDRRDRRRRARDARAGGDPAARQPDQADRGPRDPARQPRAGGLRRQARRTRAPPPHAAPHACSRARRRRWRPSRTAGSRPGTSS